jgi:MFS family permease
MRNEGDEAVRPTKRADAHGSETRERRGDARLILVMRGLRSLGYGLLAVILGVVLAGEGFSPAAIGVLITVSLIGDMAGTYVIGLVADTWGRRRTLSLLSLLMAVTGVVFGLVTSYPVLLVAAFFGTLGTSASETAPFLPIDQAMLAQITPPPRRTVLFARYNLVASLSAAVGALAAGLPDVLVRVGLPLPSGVRLLFGVYALLGLIVAGLSLRLPSPVEAPLHAPVQVTSMWQRLVSAFGRSRGIVWRLTTLFSVDALAGGLVVQSLVALFFHLRFDVPLTTLSALFFGANLLPALRPAQHDGVHPPALQSPAGPGGFRTHLSRRGSTAALAPGALADRRADSSGLHNGPGGPTGAHRCRQRDLAGAQCGISNQSDLLRPAA